MRPMGWQTKASVPLWYRMGISLPENKSHEIWRHCFSRKQLRPRRFLRSHHNLGQKAEYIWHDSPRLGDVDAVILPGGFAYGDYLRCGAIARFSPVMGAVRRFEIGR